MSNTITPIFTANATPPGGHYSQAVTHGGLIYVSGQLGFEAGSTEPIVGTIEEQTKNCIANMEAILKAAGSDLSKVIKTTVYVSHVDHWPAANAAYAECFGDHKPARAIVPCGKLHHGFDVEIDAIAEG